MNEEYNAEHAGIACSDIADACDQLLKDGVPAAHVVTALIMHAAAVAKFGNVCPHATKAAFACIISDPDYRAMKSRGAKG